MEKYNNKNERNFKKNIMMKKMDFFGIRKWETITSKNILCRKEFKY